MYVCVGVAVDKKIPNFPLEFPCFIPYYDVNYLLTRFLMFTHFSPTRLLEQVKPLLKTIQRVVKIKKLSSLAHRYRRREERDDECDMGTSRRISNEKSKTKWKICLNFLHFADCFTGEKKKSLFYESWES